MHWFLFGALLLFASIVGAHLFVRTSPEKLARVIRLVVGGLLLTLTLPLIIRLGFAVGFPVLLAGAAILYAGLRNKRVPWRGGGHTGTGGTRPGGAGDGHSGGYGQKSNVETKTLRMTLDHSSGAIDGTVLSGPFRGQSLSDLDVSDLAALLAICRESDRPSAELIETYIERHRSEEWEIFRDQFAESESAGDDSYDFDYSKREASGRAPGRNGKMSVDEAIEILGVSGSASADEIKSAHRRLMKKYHPDHGGSDYLAAKINEAKDVLLSQVG